jgi:3-hydroxyisobutyrate dehydrogenase-like beta-hydroxyacid dehydrogenase
MRVGFIGLGRMGQGMAGRILHGGHDLAVYNRTSEKAADLVAAGARLAESIAEASRDREIVVTMVANDAVLEEVVLGLDGIRDALPAGAIHMTMGTHGVTTVTALAAAHAEAAQSLVAAPVLGRPDLAASGELGIVAAGPPEAVDRCRPLLELIGRRTFEAGERAENATSVKLANNFVLGCAIEVMGEAFALVRKYDVAPEVLYDVMVDGLFAAPAYKVYGKIMIDQDYDRAGFTAALGVKDANLVMAAADLARVPMPSLNVWRDRLVSALAHGDGDKDWAIMAREQARASGLE